MRAAWETVKLDACCTKIGSGATPRGGKEAYLDEGPFALVRSQNILDFFFSYNGLAFIDKAQADQLNNVEIKENDVLLNITGDSVARVCQVPNSLLPARVNQHVSIIRPDESKLTPEFLKYYLLNPKFKNHMLGLASVGGTRNALTKGMIEDFEIDLPPLDTQRNIVAILSTLDEKIELNRQTNQTLEAIAQALFKEWFVDFNFPGAAGEMQESELGPIPVGWKVGQLDDVLVLQRGFDLPANTRISGKYPVIAASGPSGTHNEFKATGPGVVTGRSGVLGKAFFVHEDFWPLNTSLWIKEYKNSTPLFAFYLLQGLDLGSFNAGSAVPTLNRNHVHNLPVLLPPMEVIRSFGKLVMPLKKRQRVHEDETISLITTRDALLPKLMNGEIVV